MDQSSYNKLCEIIEHHANEFVKVGEVFEGIRLITSKALQDLINDQNRFSKKELIGLFASIVVSSFALSLADEVAVGEQRKTFEQIENEIKPETLKKKTEELKN